MLEHRIRDWHECIVELTDGALHLRLMQPVEQFQLDEHVVFGHHALALRQFLELLLNDHVLHKVHITSLRNVEFHPPDLIGGILHNVKIAREAHILLVVGQKSELDHTVVLDGQRVLQIVAVKRNGRIGDWALEMKLQESAFLIIDIHIGEAVLQRGVEDFTRVDEFVDTS